MVVNELGGNDVVAVDDDEGIALVGNAIGIDVVTGMDMESLDGVKVDKLDGDEVIVVG